MRKNRPKFQKERPPDQHAVGTDWRLFISLPMPQEVQDQIARVVSELSEFEWPIRWVAADSAHLTLHFLGETPPEQAELLRLGLESAIGRHGPFSMGTGDLGVFPDFKRPRVLWLGLTGQTDTLAALHNDIGRQLIKLGFEVDNRRFHPHVTLGRVRENPPASLGPAFQRALNEPRIAGLVLDQTQTIDVNEVLLMRSFLERGGARHVPIARYPLNGGTR
jgi:2'-5' RNA ligase